MDTLKATVPSPRWTQRAGFSLVEVTIAIGIVSFAFIPIFGLIPTGLAKFHVAMKTSVTAQIAQRVIGNAQQTDFETLKKTPTSSRYFDEEGAEVLSSQKWLYHAVTAVNAPVEVAGISCASLGNVSVQVISDPSNRTRGVDTPVTQRNGLTIETYSGLVSANK